ncbi:MAG: hypothetical protein K0R54_4792 [Clostridiaceae bacterium]|jgi:hypothetical protein|nr:hypothetical protein [Clostridiaceae bacterium]
MATPYSDVINAFLEKVNDTDLPSFTDIEKEEIVTGYLISACRKFYKICVIDLSDRDDVLAQFNQDLDDEVVDILVEIMMVEWLKPKLLSSENLRSCLTTSDYKIINSVSLASIRDTYDLCKKDIKSLINRYSYYHGDFKEIGGI